jgi:DNA-binding NarL/FixJ family response regulator
MPGSGLQVMVADDHALIRQGLIALLRASEPSWTLREAGSLADLRTAQEEASADLAVLDLRMPGMMGTETLRHLRSDWPETLLVVLTGVDDRSMILECLDAGVHGYVLKTSSTPQILQALRSVLAGSVYVPSELAHAAAERARPETLSASALQGFTGRQQEVLGLLAEGRSTKDIARILNLGVGTVKVHLSAIYRILGAHNRMEAVVRAGALRS